MRVQLLRASGGCVLFRKTHKEAVIQTVPSGTEEMILCSVDEKRRVRYRLRAGGPVEIQEGLFNVLDGSSRTVDHPLLKDAFDSGESVSFVFSHAAGLKKYVYLLPYEYKQRRYAACVQVTAASARPDPSGERGCALAENRAGLLLIDAAHEVRKASPSLPPSFGYVPEDLVGMMFRDLFPAPDFERIKARPADTNEPIPHCTFYCVDGSKRDVEIRKFSLPDGFMLYAVCDVSPRQRGEELVEVSARERQRIGQDLHDSIGQTLTGISLLSRSLANQLNRGGHAGSEDASMISGLADEASNQIRQISRGLMPADVVQNGLFAALRELARVTTGSCGIACDARMDDTIRFPDVAIETHLYRIAQEAVNNAIRHSGARRIEIVVSEDGGIQLLEIIDDGQWAEPASRTIGMGLQTMEYRATAVGGRLSISSLPQGGTRVACELVCDESLISRI